ncbi:MAG: type II toxin-antitoxin system HicA family toxin [Lachnospiraceae bacterium]|nr:type II toxin-antitoxin system HicA family toxin [Lachnospiraceae bacterium]MBR4755022.1 type II toxin-antitoxin system HicA family toxin [Lachnospiraceae bacterium]MBR4807210.1 type II toxin-antitoxin system HicA family toxin [Lachnospiraceae bacterium]
MPSKYPILKPEEVIRRIEKAGFKYVSQKGSHRKYSDGNRSCIIPMHDEVAKGTLKSIISQMGISLEEFLDL